MNACAQARPKPRSGWVRHLVRLKSASGTLLQGGADRRREGLVLAD